jgi:hypothetical protein
VLKDGCNRSCNVVFFLIAGEFGECFGVCLVRYAFGFYVILSFAFASVSSIRTG